MKYLFIVILICFAATAEARTRVKVGIFGTSVRTTDCGVNIQASRCGAQVGYGHGHYGGGCNTGGGCGVHAEHHGHGGCGTGHAHARCATCPQNGCVPCEPQYGTRTHTCTDSHVPYEPAAAMQMQQLRYAPPQVYGGAQMRFQGGY